MVINGVSKLHYEDLRGTYYDINLTFSSINEADRESTLITFLDNTGK